ncbi:MAG TPA: PAS domain-containing protein [Rhodanobacteraceae bacterium]|nr:PAS domain-containing protein [Rhodanobacteraceae bacterium]
MAKHRGQFGVLEAIPGGHASLRWFGWFGIGLLVIPAGVLAVLATTGSEIMQVAGNVALFLRIAGLCALTGSGMLLACTLGSLRRLAELAQMLCEQGEAPVFIKDAAQRYRFVNEAAAGLIGRRLADVLGRRDSELQPGSDALAWEENDRVCLDRDLPTMFREVQATPSGERSFLVSKRPLHDARGRVSGLVGAARDITDELELQKLTRRRADETRVWFDLNPLPVVVFASSDLRILSANAAAEQCYGYPRQRFQQLHVSDLFSPAEAGRLRTYLRDAGRAVPPGSVAWQHRRASGESFDVLTDIGNLPHAEVPARMMLVRDLSTEHASRQALRECASRYDDLVESGLALVWMHDLDGRLLRVNAAMAQALGYNREDMIGRPLADFVADEGDANWNDYRDRTRSLRRDGGVLHFVARNGERRVWQYQFVCYPDAEPAPYVLASAQDATLRHRYELRLRDQNQRDTLTGCRTRRFLELFAMQATHDQVWGCVVVDIDYFRQLNASEGRERGDEVLRDLARLLGHTAGSGDVVVRLGGDEFAIVMPHTTEHGVRELADRLAVASRDGMPAVFSIGSALREADEPLESTLRRADKMLLQARSRECGSV